MIDSFSNLLAGEVRELAIKILIDLYKVKEKCSKVLTIFLLILFSFLQSHGSIVKRYLPPDDDRTRRVKKYRDIYEEFERIDTQVVKPDVKVVQQVREKNHCEIFLFVVSSANFSNSDEPFEKIESQ